MELRSYVMLAIMVFSLDTATVVMLFSYVHSWGAMSAGDFFSSIQNFRQDVSDCLVALAVRLILVPALIAWACRLGKPILETQVTESMLRGAKKTNIGNGGESSGNGKHSTSSERTPLLSTAHKGHAHTLGSINAEGSHEDGEEGGITVAEGRKKRGANGGGAAAAGVGEDEEQHHDSETSPLLSSSTSAGKDGADSTSILVSGDIPSDNPSAVTTVREKIAYDINQRADLKKNAILVTIFLINTACQAFVGIKCISFTFGSLSEGVAGSLMGTQVLYIMLESALSQWIVTAATKVSGHLIKTFHVHPLYYIDSLPGHMCDLCRSRMRRGYRCKLCDFDVCVACFSSKDKSRGEGVLRGDKGVKEEKEVTNTIFMKRAFALCRPQIHLFIVAFFCLLASALASLFLPNYQGEILDQVVAQDHGGFMRCVLFYLGLSIATGFFGAVKSLAFNIVGRRMSAAVRERLFSSIVVQDIAFFDGVHSGDLTSRLTNDISAMVAPCQSMLGSLLQNCLSLIGGVIMCFYTSWRLSMLAFTMVAPIAYCTDVYATWSRKLNAQIYAALGDAMQVASEALANIRTVRSFSTELQEIQRYTVFVREALRNGLRDAWGGAGTYALTNYLDLGAGVLILWYGGSLALDDSSALTVGKLITFQLYWNMISSAYNGFADLLNSFTRAGGAAQRVISLLDMLPDIDPSEGRMLDGPLVGNIEFSHVGFTYQMRPDKPVLRDLSLRVPAGQVFAFVGKSGGGKSTILSLLMRMYDPSAGAILVDGQDLRSLNLRSYHEQVGIVTQDTQLFNATIEQNIAYGLDHYTKEELYQAARNANAHDFIAAFPDGYNTRVGERGVRLSGGQKQRIAIARAFLRSPRILLLDEATSALDAESEAQVQAALDRLIAAGNHTVLLVAHRLSTVQHADQIAVVDGGTIVERGTHTELLAADGTYARLVKRQLTRQRNQIPERAQAADVVDALVDEEEPAAGEQR